MTRCSWRSNASRGCDVTAGVAPGRRPRRRLLGALGVAAAAGAGCGQWFPPRNLKPPTVRFSDLSLGGVSGGRAAFTVTLETTNPNEIDIPLSNVRFELFVMGQRLGEGSVPEPRFTLPANGTRNVPVAFTVDGAALRAALVGLAIGPPADAFWELRGSANWGSSPIPIAFERRGDAGSLRKLREWLGR